jgi:hypothetical protein
MSYYGSLKFAYLNKEVEEGINASGHFLRWSWPKFFLTFFLILCTGFSFMLPLYWFPALRAVMLYSKCGQTNATNVFIETMGHKGIPKLEKLGENFVFRFAFSTFK